MDKPRDLYTVAEAAAIVGVETSTITHRHRARGIGRKYGQQIMFTPSEVRQLVQWPHNRGRPARG